jgi:hypothetical protein
LALRGFWIDLFMHRSIPLRVIKPIPKDAPSSFPSPAQSAFPSTRFPIPFFWDILLRSNGANPSDLLGRKVLL